MQLREYILSHTVQGIFLMSRRKKRYERRKSKRNSKRIENLSQYDNFEKVISCESLYDAASEAAKGVSWKESVQRYMLNICMNIAKTHKELKNGKDIQKGFIEFDVVERGKLRHIKSVHFYERVVQKSLCRNALYPILTYNLIYDNGASQKGKGTHFTVKRLIKHLQSHYRKHGNSGYVLLIDFKSYFDNINHKPLKDIYYKYFSDKKLIKLSEGFIDAFGEIGLGLGSETSQLNAIAYPNKVDHYIKEVGRVKGYGRYMDDSYIIHESKEFLQELLKDLSKIYDELGIKLNQKKTYITDLKYGFTFLKTRFHFSDTGKIIKKPCRASITQERRKLKRQAKLVEKEIMTYEQVSTSYQSWRGSMKYRNARKTLYNMDLIFEKLFNKEGEKKK